MEKYMKTLWAPWRFEYIASANEAEEECIFCTKPNEFDDKKNLIVYRSSSSFIMLNKYPYNNGHLMIVPFVHECDLNKLKDEILLDLQHNLQKAILVLKKTIHPHGLNIGINIGRTAGAGIDQHLHYHLVPRWNGDTNFMPVISGTKVLSESLSDTWRKLKKEFDKF
jgi:ATP adenylyltransferase